MYNFITERGIVLPDTSETMSDVHAEWREIFGEDIDLSPETIQGVIASMMIEQRDNVARTVAELANQINPDIAQGVFLDALLAFLGGERRPATHTIIHNVEMFGIPDTLIPKGSIARAGDHEFALTMNQIIGKDGKAVGDFIAVESGEIEVNAHELDEVASSVLGWESVVNKKAGVTGKERERDASVRARREQTLGLQGVGEVENIISGLFNIREVHSLSYFENKTDKPQTVDGITVKPHGLYTCIYGGKDEEIALVFNKKKNVGSSLTGSHTVTIKDPITDKDYTVNFDRPVEKNLFVRVTVRDSAINAQSIIPDIVKRWANGESEADVGLMVGRSVSPFEIASAINIEQPTLFVKSVELSTDGAKFSQQTIELKINEIAILADNISVVVE